MAFGDKKDDDDLIYESDFLDTELNLFKINSFEFVKEQLPPISDIQFSQESLSVSDINTPLP